MYSLLCVSLLSKLTLLLKQKKNINISMKHLRECKQFYYQSKSLICFIVVFCLWILCEESAPVNPFINKTIFLMILLFLWSKFCWDWLKKHVFDFIIPFLYYGGSLHTIYQHTLVKWHPGGTIAVWDHFSGSFHAKLNQMGVIFVNWDFFFTVLPNQVWRKRLRIE